jgi:hypothetical protein
MAQCIFKANQERSENQKPIPKTKELKMKNETMTTEEFTQAIVDMFEMTTKERLMKQITNVLNSGCIDPTEYSIPTAKAFLNAFFELEGDGFVPPVNSSYTRSFKKLKKNIRYFMHW